MNPSRIVISSVAAIGPHGRNMDQLLSHLAGDSPPPGPAPTVDELARPRRGRSAFRVPDLDLDDLVTPRAARRMSRSSVWAAAAARLAMQEAGLKPGPRPGLGVYTATAFGPSGFTSGLLAQIFGAGPQTASPFLFTDCVANAPAGQSAIAVQAQGPNVTICQRESGPLQALAQASRDLRWGRISQALVGAVDELDAHQLEILDRMGALTKDPRGPRPFALGRDGTTAGEGASYLLLEPESMAQVRDHLPLCLVLASGRGFDPSAPPAGWGEGAESFATQLRQSLQDAHLEPAQIDAVVCGASGSRRGDALEAAVLHRVFGTEHPPLLTPKARLGEYGGGTLATAVLAATGPIRVRTDASRPDPQLPCRPSVEALTGATRRVLATGLGTGGAGAWAILEGL